MTKGTELKKFENAEDIFKCTWSVDNKGKEVMCDWSALFSFTINKPTATTWKHLKDFNAWHEDLHYSGVVGDQPIGGTFELAMREEAREYYKKHYGVDPSYKKTLIMRNNVRESELVFEEWSADRGKIAAYYVFVLHGSGDRTTITGMMSYGPQWVPQASEGQVRATYQSNSSELEERWKKSYIPRLRQLIEGR